MTLPRVLLVEDDPAVRRFVDAVLEDQGVVLRTTSRIADAIGELAAAPFALVVTDLMLAGESGRSLVERMRDEPALGGRPRVTVMSAGLSPEISADLLGLGAWRLLDKPVSVAQLRQCVRDALDARQAPWTALAPPVPDVLEVPIAPSERASVIDTYFGGNVRIYRAYRDTCEQQFLHDLAEGERAFGAQDVAAMRRLAHTLKSVFQALGHAPEAHAARAVDLACLQNDWAAVTQHWASLRAALRALIATTDR